jgi:hypothetical protein
LLAENGTRGVPMPGPGVGRLLKPEAAPTPERVSTPPSVATSVTKPEVRGVAMAAAPAWSAGVRRSLWAADVALVGVGFWLGAMSPLAGQAIALVAAGVLLAIGALLGVLAAA